MAWIPTSSVFLLLYCSGARASSSSAVFIVIFPTFLLWMLTSIYNRIIDLRWWGLKPLVSLWMINYMPLWSLFGEYPVHQGKLNLFHLNSLSSGSINSVFPIVGMIVSGLKMWILWDVLLCWCSPIYWWGTLHIEDIWWHISGVLVILWYVCLCSLLLIIWREESCLHSPSCCCIPFFVPVG